MTHMIDSTNCEHASDGTQCAALLSEALKSNLAMELVQDLTLKIGPRFAGSSSELASRNWAVDWMKKLGFKNIRIEEFEIPGWYIKREESYLLTPHRQKLAISTLGGSPSTPPDGIKARIAFFNSMDEFLSSSDDDISGRIVFINDRMERSETGLTYSIATVKRKFGAIEAAKRNAAAILIRSVNTSSHRFASTGQQWFNKNYPTIPAVSVSNQDADTIERLISKNIDLEIELYVETAEHNTCTSGNVIGEIEGKMCPEEIVLLAAHLDTWYNTSGVLDDGVGIATVVSAASLLNRPACKPDRTIRVVLYGAEEVGAFGAFAYANRYGPPFQELIKSIEPKPDGSYVWHNAVEQMSNWKGFRSEENLGKNFQDHVVAIEADNGGGRPTFFSTNVDEPQYYNLENLLEELSIFGMKRGPNEYVSGVDIIPLKMSGVEIASIGQDLTYYFDYHHTADDTLDKLDPTALKALVAAYTLFTKTAATIPEKK